MPAEVSLAVTQRTKRLQFLAIGLLALFFAFPSTAKAEHIYWNQASVLKQLGLLPDQGLPVYGAQTARKVLDPKFDPNSA